MKHLNWFLGPKAENSEFLIEAINKIVLDYVHWRRNYFPNDKILINKNVQREHIEILDNIEINQMEMLSELRRNIPMYNPRYLGHMISDISLPSIIGYLSGMLYNSNNVTTEVSSVTMEWEIDACNQILDMIGFIPSPSPPKKDAGIDAWKIYKEKLKEDFGWAHITSGGSMANIESLWVARIIKYQSLAIQDIAILEDINFKVKLPNNNFKNIKDITQLELLYLTSTESMKLFSKLVFAISKKRKISITDSNKISSKLISDSQYSTSNHLGKIFNQFEPIIFSSGAIHYSIRKAADILGIGRSNIIFIKTDSQLRMDINDLKEKYFLAISQNKIPIAVIAIAGTTEAGSVDPIHEIVAFREELEKSNMSFWLHIDSAWGGYISTLFKLEEDEEIEFIINKICNKLVIHSDELTDTLKIKSILDKTFKIPVPNNNSIKEFTNHLQEIYTHLENDIKIKKEFLIYYKKLYNEFGSIIFIDENRKLNDLLNENDFQLTKKDRFGLVSKYVKDDINFSLNSLKNDKTIHWGVETVLKSFLAFDKADSITVDPHKLGYIQYPCGVVAFKSDKIRHFIMQKAPYITSSDGDTLLHTPPRHIRETDFDKIDNNEIPFTNYHVAIDSFGPFMLDGSRPGASAAALWFSCKTIPLNRTNHGLIVKESLIAARELYEWIHNWEKIYKESKISDNLHYEFKNLCVPDTNLIVFVIKAKSSNKLEDMNKLTLKIYENFSIQTELGSKKYSYAQPFFLTKTTMHEDSYNYETFINFFNDCGIIDSKNDFIEHGLTLLRTTVMNPYITEIRRRTNQNIIKEFVWELHKCANKLSVEL